MKRYSWKNKKRKMLVLTLLWVIVVVFIVAIIFGVHTKRSFINDINNNHFFYDKKIKLSTYDQQFEEDKDGLLNYEDISSINDLIDKSDCVLKIKLVDEDKRKNCATSMLSKVQVVKVYKGKLLKKQCIMLLEYIEPTKTSILSVNGYNVIKKDKEYIVFLRKYKNRHYTIEHTSEEKLETDSIYIPISPVLGKYPVDDSYKKVELLDKKRLCEEDEPYKYETVKKYEIFTDNPKVLKQYIFIGKQVHKKYGRK